MAFIDKKNAKVVRERLANLAGQATLAVFTREFEFVYCRQTRRASMVERFRA
jgi:hypothetical protein